MGIQTRPWCRTLADLDSLLLEVLNVLRCWILLSACSLAFSGGGMAAFGQGMPREDVVDVQAVGEGLCVSNLFQSQMVLQRDKPIAIWGWADLGEIVTVTLGGTTQSTTAGEDRSWKVTLPAMAASSEATTLVIQGSKITLTLDDILLGDVWILGGQSNMEFPLDRIENGQLEIVSANYPNIRILTVPAANGPDNRASFQRLHEWSDWFGRHYRKGDWDACSPEIARELSAIGYVFARRLHTASQVPIGVVDVSRGGTTVETWTPEPLLRNIDTEQVVSLLKEWDQKVESWDATADLATRVERHRQKMARLKADGQELPSEEEPTDLRPGPAMDQNRPGNCFASMIHPLAGLSVKGAIFHQGYNNCFSGTEGAVLYRQVFPVMIDSWRRAFADPEMPFGIISLCTEGTPQTLDNYSELMFNAGPYVREAQYQTFLELYNAGDKHIGFTSTYDLRRRWYHPQLKIPAGERIARWALASEYGMEKQIRWKPPIVSHVIAQDGQIALELDEQAEAIDDGGPIVGFAIAGDDRKFHPATATHLVTGEDDRGRPKLDKSTLVLTSPMVPEPKHYRYAWGRSPLGNLQASRLTDIPFATQRSDNWPMEQVPLGVISPDTIGKLARPDSRKLQDALKTLDRERQIFKANALLKTNQ